MPRVRWFFWFSLGMALIVMIAVPLLGRLTSIEAAPPDVGRGFSIWRANGCAACHTLYGQGQPLAPDLTQAHAELGEERLRDRLTNPSLNHPTSVRISSAAGLTLSDTDAMIAFLRWASQHDSTRDGSRTTTPSSDAPARQTEMPPIAAPDDPVAQGRYWFVRAPASCSSCHALEPNVALTGPSLAGIARVAGSRVAGQDAATYLRRSILHPSDYIVPGYDDVMAKNLAQVLSAEQVDQIVAFLLTLD